MNHFKLFHRFSYRYWISYFTLFNAKMELIHTGGNIMTRKAFNTKTVSSSGPYSHVTDAGDFLFFSGQTAKNRIDLEEDLTGDIAKQTEVAFNNLFDVMADQGVSESDVVKVNVYLTTMKNFEAMNEVYKTKFSEPFPSRTCVAVYELPLGAEVEIEIIVKK